MKNEENDQFTFSISTGNTGVTLIDNNHGNIVADFNGMSLETNENSRISLLQAGIYFTWPLVSATQKNNATFKVSYVPTPIDIIGNIPDGIYDIAGLNNYIFEYIHDHLQTYHGITIPVSPRGFNITINQYNGLVTITCNADFVLDFSTDFYAYIYGDRSQLYRVLGFTDYTDVEAITDTTIVSPNHADISDINSYFINCELVNDSLYNGESDHNVLQQFITTQYRYGSLMNLTPSFLIHHKMKAGIRIKNFKIWITDDSNNIIPVREPVTYFLMFEHCRLY